jgi:hypothetical protein
MDSDLLRNFLGVDGIFDGNAIDVVLFSVGEVFP